MSQFTRKVLATRAVAMCLTVPMIAGRPGMPVIVAAAALDRITHVSSMHDQADCSTSTTATP